jgi:hypothetical protein
VGELKYDRDIPSHFDTYPRTDRSEQIPQPLLCLLTRQLWNESGTSATSVPLSTLPAANILDPDGNLIALTELPRKPPPMNVISRVLRSLGEMRGTGVGGRGMC